MSPKTRSTTRISASIDTDVGDRLEEFSEEHNESKSRVVENALREYFDMDRVAQIEEKIDLLLDRVDDSDEGSPTLSGETSEKEKENSTSPKNQAESEGEDEDDFEYDPDSEPDRELTTDEIHSILSQPDPEINPEHIGNRVPRDSGPRLDLLMACARYEHYSPSENLSTITPDEAKAVIKKTLGKSDHILGKYLPMMLNELPELKRANGDSEIVSVGMYALNKESRKWWYSNLFDDGLADAGPEYFKNRDELSQYRTQLSGLKDEFLELDITTKEQWEACVENLHSIDLADLEPAND